MRITVLTDDGQLMTLDTADALAGVTGLSAAARADAAKGLKEIADILSGSEHSVVAAIKTDIQEIVRRIELELGAHPAFTWAQTTLSNAAAHLEHYVQGIWTEPPVVQGVTTDARGVIIAVQPPPAS